MTLANGHAGAQLEVASLLGCQCGPAPREVLLVGQNMPGDNCELARGGHRSYLLPASPADAQEERAQRTR